MKKNLLVLLLTAAISLAATNYLFAKKNKTVKAFCIEMTQENPDDKKDKVPALTCFYKDKVKMQMFMESKDRLVMMWLLDFDSSEGIMIDVLGKSIQKSNI